MSAPRPTQDQVPPHPTPPPQPPQRAGSLEGAEICTPSPAPPNSVPGGAGLVSIFGRTAASAPARHRHLASYERRVGAGGRRRVRGGPGLRPGAAEAA